MSVFPPTFGENYFYSSYMLIHGPFALNDLHPRVCTILCFSNNNYEELVILKCGTKKWYEACPESKNTKVLNMYNIFNLQKRHCEWIACT